MSSPPVLTIAGSDPSGGAGIQADLKTFSAFQCYGMAAVTALTVQNTLGVQGVHAVSPDAVEQQIVAVVEDIRPKAIKTGMLYDADNTRALVRALSSLDSLPPIVVDPVSVSTSGHSLLSPSAVETIVSDLLPLASLITPNKAETELLLSHSGTSLVVETLADMMQAANQLLSLGPTAVLIKGGHVTLSSLDPVAELVESDPDVRVFKDCGVLEEGMEILVHSATSRTERFVVDVLSTKEGERALFVRPFIDSDSTHGTGCTLSAAIAAGLAKDMDLIKAVHQATVFTHTAIETAPGLGKGHGPLNHLHANHSSLIPLPSPSCPYPLTYYLIKNSTQLWKDYIQHDFVCQLGRGTLQKDHFIHFMVQDYHYLKYYSRAYGLLVAKSPNFGQMAAAARVILSIVHEIGTHKTFCAEFGLTEEEMERTPETLATRAYGGYLIDAAVQGDGVRLQVALLACLIGYGQVGLWLRKQSWVDVSSTSTNPYVKWIEDYSGEVYQTAVRVGLELIEAKAVKDPPTKEKLNEWLDIWKNVTWLEKCFWDSAMQP